MRRFEPPAQLNADRPNADRIDAEAARWCAKLDAAGYAGRSDAIDAFAATDQSFATWIEADLRHRVVLLRLWASWARADRLASLKRPSEAVEPAPRWRRWVGGAIAAALVLMAVPVAGLLIQGEPTTPPTQAIVYETEIGGYETAPLADGSRIELNTNTRLGVVMDDTARTVRLVQGEAFFDVARDEARPFTVTASGHQVTVLGTQFTVREDRGDLHVLVREGQVAVQPANTAPQAAPVMLVAGQRLIVTEAGVRVDSADRAMLDAALAWREGLLVFNGERLEAVADAFNRHNTSRLVILDPYAREMEIGGQFEAANVEAFVRLLETAFGLEVERVGDSFFVRGRTQ